MKTVITIASICVALLALTGPVYAQDGGTPPVCPADSYEPNNVDTQASAIVAGEYTDLTACVEDDLDWYAVDVPGNNGLVVDLSFAGDEADLDLYLYNAEAPSVPLHTSMSSGNTEQAFVAFFVEDTTVLIKVKNFDAHNDRWTPYSMQVTTFPGGYHPCGEGDALEPNDSSSDAAYLALPFSDSNMSICDEDWYIFSAPAGQGIQVSMDFIHADADINMALFDNDNTNVPLVRASGSSNNETLCYGADDSSQVFLLHVYEQGGLQNGETSYTLNVALSNEPCEYQPEPLDAGSNDTRSNTDAGQVEQQDSGTMTGNDASGNSGDASTSLCSNYKGAGNSALFVLIAMSFLGVLRRR